MRSIKTDIFQLLDNWFEKRSEYWTIKGFKITKGQPYTGRNKNSIEIEVEKGQMFSSITIWETGECDFLQVGINDSDKVNYFKNVILMSEDQTNWELDNFFFNYDSLKGSSVDPYHNPDGL